LCGGILVWDYQTGEVICSSCGYVIDKIYYYGPVNEDENEAIWREVRMRKNPKRNPSIHRYRYHLKLYHEAYSYVKNKPWLEINYEKIFESGKMINTLKSHATLEAEKNISSKNLWRTIYEGLKFIEKNYPVALARSGRGKYALAYIVSTYLNHGKIPDIKEVVNTFNISETSYRRLVKIAKEIVSIKTTISR